MKTHFIAMAGMRGCLPNYCDVYPDRESAIDSLATIHDMGDMEGSNECVENLEEYGFTDLDIHIHGNEYAEVIECNCPDPQEHSEHEIDPDDFV